MKFLRIGPKGFERPAVISKTDGLYRDLTSIVSDICPDTLDQLSSLAQSTIDALPTIDGRIGAPITRFHNLICIGLNYKEHADETSSKLPKEPVIFQKPVTCVVGPNDPITIPRNATKVDWEVELALVIGRKCKYVSKNEAKAYIFGYSTFFDVSERVFQKERGGGQFFKGKCCDGFGPLGPYIDTEIVDPSNLNLFCQVNSVVMQDSNTSKMIFSPFDIVSHISQFMTLWPGDVIATGTPSGVGAGRGIFLKTGDVVRLGVEGLGEHEHVFVSEDISNS